MNDPAPAPDLRTLLLCTVGGSHVPIVRAIQESGADYVCFLCTGPDPNTGKAGSDAQIEGQGFCIRERPTDDKPTLPNIPSQCGLAAGRYELRRVPSDDLDAIHGLCREALADLRRRYPQARLLADYTGGTKSMSAALVLAALDSEDVELQLVTGNRVDLVRVRDGAETAAPATIEAIRLQRRMQPYLNAWTRHAYAEAEAGLRRLPTPANATLRGRLNRARDLSAAFAAWDAFDHAGAFQRLHGYAAALADDTRPLLGVLRVLTEGEPLQREAAQLLDLYRNAERRFAQGRHDDGVARLYRLLEWTAQWLLQRDCQVSTGDLPPDWVPQLPPNRDGKRQAGLFEAWRLVAERTRGPLAAWHRDRREPMLDYLRARNASILAHGFAPVGAAAGRAFHDWLAGEFLDALLQETAPLGLRRLPPQLPADPGDALPL